jgi:hypothetical protein
LTPTRALSRAANARIGLCQGKLRNPIQRRNPMPDDEARAGGGIPGSVYDLITQLRGVTDRLTGLTGLPKMSAMTSLPSLPRPGALSAAQLKAMTSAVAAQRSSIEALQTQLRAFDEQLAMLEGILEPVTEWITTWADLETKVMDLRPGAGG